MTTNARKRARRLHEATRLHSGQYGAGGRTSNGNGHSDVATSHTSHTEGMRGVKGGKIKEIMPATWSQRVAGNTTKLYRNER